MRQIITTTRTFRVLALVALLLAPVSARAEGENARRTTLIGESAVVRFYSGLSGTFYCGATNDTYNVSFSSTGSGAFINPDGYILTNAHVVEYRQMTEQQIKDELVEQYVARIAKAFNIRPSDVQYNEKALAVLRSSRLTKSESLHRVVLPNGALLAYDVKVGGQSAAKGGKDIAIAKVQVQNAPTLRIGNSDGVKVTDTVTVVGYPGAADISGPESKSFYEPSADTARITSLKTLDDGSPVLQIGTTNTGGGNSGGPVLDAQGNLVGVLTLGSSENPGIHWALTTSTVMEFVRQAGITNDSSITDRTFGEALDLYFGHHFSAAITKFEESARLYPNHAEAADLIKESQFEVSNGNDVPVGQTGPQTAPSRRTWVWVGGAVVALLAFLLVAGAVVAITVGVAIRSRKASAAAEPEMKPAPLSVVTPQTGSASRGATVFINRETAPEQPASCGFIEGVAGPLAGRRFPIPAAGCYIGRDGSIAEIEVADDRISKRHVWIGRRDGRVAAVDAGSTNGTYLNTLSGPRVTETTLASGDVLILSDANAAQFRYVA